MIDCNMITVFLPLIFCNLTGVKSSKVGSRKVLLALPDPLDKGRFS